MTKLFQRISKEIMNLPFYRHRTNWHKLPGIRALLCRIGRHDYEFVSLQGESAVLECFYCDYGKRTSLRNLVSSKGDN